MHRLTTTIAAVSLALAATPALAAETGAQTTAAKAGQPSPIRIGGTQVKQGTTLKAGQTVIRRATALEGKERASTTLTCAAGATLRGLASSQTKFTWVTASKESYVGKRSVKVKLFGRAADGQTTTAAMYALCAR